MDGKNNIDMALRGFKSMIGEIEEGKRAFFYVDFEGGRENEQELIDELRALAEEHGLAFEVEYDDGDLVIWVGEREYLKPSAGDL